MPRPALGPQRRTNAVIWFAAMICAIVAVAVITIGIFVIAGIVIKAKNGNIKNHVRFYGLELILALHGLQIAKLVSKPFDVKKNDSLEFFYLVKSNQIPLRSVYRDYVQSSLKKSTASLELKGTTTTRWKVWVLDSVKITLHMDCDLHFVVPNGSLSTKSHCRSKSS
ncbi:uncharacterized protein LOC141686644 [Apium graveolens]|uniref:uncharacterized protein LOC141686644 n=1 Tax=Apium graveolens TaxID=4045 RepID=UPI003D7AC4CB